MITADEFLFDPDRTSTLMGLKRYAATILCAEIRRHDRRATGWAEALEAVARWVLEHWVDEHHARATALAGLLDVGGADGQVRNHLLVQLEAGTFSAADLRVAARLMGERGHRASNAWLHTLADEVERNPQGLTRETVTTIIDRLHGRWLPEGDPREHLTMETMLADLTDLEQPVEVPGVPGLRLRPLRSRQQLDRFSNHLKNCASSYLALVKSGATRLLGLELDGTPVELIEVHPRTGIIKQWKGYRNGAPDPARRRLVESFLVSQRLAVAS